MESAGVAVRGSGWFLGGSIVLIAFGAVHLLGARTSAEPGALELIATLKAYKVPMGPVEPSAWDAQQILSASYTVFLFFVGGLGVVMRGRSFVRGRCGGSRLCTLGFRDPWRRSRWSGSFPRRWFLPSRPRRASPSRCSGRGGRVRRAAVDPGLPARTYPRPNPPGPRFVLPAAGGEYLGALAVWALTGIGKIGMLCLHQI